MTNRDDPFKQAREHIVADMRRLGAEEAAATVGVALELAQGNEKLLEATAETCGRAFAEVYPDHPLSQIINFLLLLLSGPGTEPQA